MHHALHVDLAVLLACTVISSVLVLRANRRGGPHEASDYRVWANYAWFLMAVFAGLLVFHLIEGTVLLAVIAVVAVLLFASAAVFMHRFARFVERLPEVLEPGESLRAFAIGFGQVENRRRSVALLLTDRSLVTAARDGATPRRLGEHDLADVAGVRTAGRWNEGYLEVETPSGLTQLTGVPQRQARDLIAGVEPRG